MIPNRCFSPPSVVNAARPLHQPMGADWLAAWPRQPMYIATADVYRDEVCMSTAPIPQYYISKISSVSYIKSVVFGTLYLQIQDCSKATVGIVGKLLSDRLICTIPKCIPIWVSGLWPLKVSLISTTFTFFPMGQYEKGQRWPLFGGHIF